MENGLVEISDPHFIVELMYAGTDHNMTGCPVYTELGLGNRALIRRELWQALQRLIPYLENTGRRMKIYDACRPVEAHNRLVGIIPRDGFFAPEASSSPHCRAAAVDVSLIGEDGRELIYPTLVDAYDPAYAREVQTGRFDNFFTYLKKASHAYRDENRPEAFRNRDELRKLMEQAGLVPPPRLHEWWHYELPDGRSEKYPLIYMKDISEKA
mgnify:CR=1 FL=1